MKKRKIIHSALSLSLTAALCLSMAACGGTQTPADSVAASALCTVRRGAALCCGDDLCGTACEGLEPQAGGGKPLHGKERREYSPRRVQHRLHG